MYIIIFSMCPLCYQILNFNYKVNFKDFYTDFVCVSQIKDIKHIEHNFHSDAWVMPQEVGLGGAGWVKNYSVGICNGAPSTGF